MSLDPIRQASKRSRAARPRPAVKLGAMPPSLHPPDHQSHKLRRRHHPAAVAKKGLAAILYNLRDVRRSPPSPSPSTPPAHYSLRCYPPPPYTWPWPWCRHPRTSSFRGRPDENTAASVFQTVNTVYDTSSEYFARRRSSMDDPRSPASPGEASVEKTGDEEDKETAIVRGMRSERMFFEPAGAEFLPKQVKHCACLPLSDGKAPVAVESVPNRERFQQPAPARGENEAADDVASVRNDDQSAATAAPFDKDEVAEAYASAVKGGAVVVTMESKDPYGDFRTSMAEMVAAHGLRDWEALEELLAWYLKLNAKGVHAAIVGAFIDLLVSMQASSPPPRSPPSPSSSCITFEECSSATFDDEEKI